MPRIRKKTSKRGSTNQRSKLKHKVAESKKKAKKAAKKSPQWKSKTPKDPGIPNNFPYKDQILAEIAEGRRLAAEAKERRKEEKKALKTQSNFDKKPAQEEPESGEEGSEDEGSQAGFDGIASFSAKGRLHTKEKGKTTAVPLPQDEDDVPTLINPDLSNLKSVIDRVHVVIEVLDARDPMACRSSQLEEYVTSKDGRKLLLVLNKIDTCALEPVSSWTKHLRQNHPTLLFRAASAFLPNALDATIPKKGKGKEPASDGWGVEAILALLEKWSQNETGPDSFEVAVVGATNTGKSAFINSLIKRSVFPIYSSTTSRQAPTTTPFAQETSIELGGKVIKFIDTPGLSWQHASEHGSEDSERVRAQDILLRSRGRLDRMKDPAPAMKQIVSRAETEDLMVFYNLPAFTKGDTNAFLSGVARANGFVKKGGALDLTGASRVVLRDWATGKLPRYAVPPNTVSGAASLEPFDDIYAKDESILSQLRTRKELRKAHGLVRLNSGVVDSRVVELEAPWLGLDESDGEDDEAEDADTVDAISETDGEEEEEDEDEDEDEDGDEDDAEEAEVLAPVGKRKRAFAATTLRPSKKVAFSASSRSSKPSSLKATAASKSASPPPLTQPILKSALKSTKSSASKKPKSKSNAVLQPTKKAPANQPSKKTVTGNSGEYDFTKYF